MTPITVPDLTDFDREVRLALYQHFAARAKAPVTLDLATELSASVEQVEDAYHRLAANRALALAPSSSNVWMAHPFSAVPTPFPVLARNLRYWANCAWDALGLPAVIGSDSSTVTQCPDCAEPITVEIRDGKPVPTSAVVHFAVPPRRFWENVGFT